MEKTKCEYCGKEIWKPSYDIRNYKYHFCCKDHFLKYRKENNYYAYDQDTKTLKKIKTLAKLRRKKNGLEND